jgi:hypothetical protein
MLKTVLSLVGITLSCFAADQQSCPVSITHLESSSNAKAGVMAALAGAASSNTWLVLKYRNETGKVISGVRFVVVYFNSVLEPVHTEDITTPTQKFKPGKTDSLIQADDYITGGQKATTAGWVAKVLFSDGTSWEDNGSRSCSTPNLEHSTPTK